MAVPRSKNHDVVILIPAYNEGPVIKQTIDEIPKHFPHIVAVDDGSTDKTGRHIRQTRARLVRHPINLGQGAALQTAIDFALQDGNYKYFVTFDADGQHSIADVEKMLKTIRSDKLDIVLGSRFLGSAVDIGKAKKLMLKMAIKFTNASTGLKLTDAHNGLRVFSRHTAEKLQLESPDFSHATEIIDRIASRKLSYAEVPVTITYTDYSRSKGQSMANAVNIVFDIVLNKLVKK